MLTEWTTEYCCMQTDVPNAGKAPVDIVDIVEA